MIAIKYFICTQCACLLNCAIKHAALPSFHACICLYNIYFVEQYHEENKNSMFREGITRTKADSAPNLSFIVDPNCNRNVLSDIRFLDLIPLGYGSHRPSADKPLEVEHNLHEFGSLQYHIQSYATEAHHAYLSISTPLLSTGSSILYGFPHHTIETVKKICREVVEIIEPARAGYQLTLKLDFTKIPRKKDAEKIITEISSVQATILSSQLKEILRSVSIQEITEGTYKPIKLVYHPNEPFYVVKQPAKLTAVFPIRLKEDSDVVIAKAFFQELVDVGRSGVCPKAPPCYWSPIPPPELRGESMKDLSTNGGFVSFDIFAWHVEGKKLDKTVWNLLNFNALVKYHVKCTKGFVQRRMRSRLDSMVEALQHTSMEDDQHIQKVRGRRGLKKLIDFRRTIPTKRWNLTKKFKRIRSRIRIRGFKKFHRGWLKLPCFSSVMKYQKLDKF